jgi:pimeloyl-ACP methyl ester carboxylesterase
MLHVAAMEEIASPLQPVSAIGPGRLAVGPGAEMPYFSTGAGLAGDVQVARAVLVLHGRQRNAGDYLAAMAACVPDGTLVIAPQFLNDIDARGWALPRSLLRWAGSDWMGGAPAAAPSAISAFAVLDAFIAHLTDHASFPVLEDILIAGHSGGGQVAQRYAVLTGADEGCRYLIANPSSYLYFDDAIDWKFGLRHRPAYAREVSAAALEQRYTRRDVTYALGLADCDPAHPALDRTPPAMAQGPHRLARGRAYVEYLTTRHPAGLRHRLVEIPRVGHDPAGIFAYPGLLYPAT